MSLPVHKHNIEEIAVHKETFQINGHEFVKLQLTRPAKSPTMKENYSME